MVRALALRELPAATAAIAAVTATAAAVATAVTATAATAAAIATAATAAAATTTVATAATAAVAATTTDRAGLGLEAVAAVDGAVTAGLEGHLGVLAARSAGHAEKLALGPASSAATVGLAGPAAVGAPTRFVREPLRCMEFLLARGERERRAAVRASDGFVGERHPTTSKQIFRIPYGHRAPGERSLSVRPMVRGYHKHNTTFFMALTTTNSGPAAILTLVRPTKRLPRAQRSPPSGKSREHG